MNIRKLYTLLALATGILLWVSNSAGPGTAQGLDRTGSPLSPGPCSACHADGAFSPTLSVELLDGGIPVSQYQPGRDYTLRVRINASGTPPRYGFQAVALTGTGNANAGTFGTAPAGFKKVALQGRSYVEHSSPRTNNTMDFPWTSPAAPGEEIRFYAAGIASNNTNGSSGDGAAHLVQPLVITPLVSQTRTDLAERLELRVLGNPIGSRLRISLKSPESGLYNFWLSSLDGRKLWSQSERLQAGENTLQFDTEGLPRGAYVLIIENIMGRASVKVIR